MKKFLSVLTAAACVTACALSFTACGGNNGGNPSHTSHSWSETFTEDGDRHYQTCNGCDEKLYGSHSYNADGVCVCGKQKDGQGEEIPPVTTPELKEMNTYFSGLKVTKNKNTVTDGNGADITFNEALDRQFETLAQDILYRLYLVYGENTYGEQSTFQNLDLNYSYNGNSAKVDKSTALTDLTEHPINHLIINIDCVFCYQNLVNIGAGAGSMFNNNNIIIIKNAFKGDFYYYDTNLGLIDAQTEFLYDSDGDGEYDDYKTYDPAPYKWLFSDYSKWNTDYRTAFKYELAKIVYGDNNTSLTYNELLSKIDVTGFSADTEQKITEAIYKTVIGENLVAENLRIYNTFSESDKSNLKNWTGDEVEKHYFKGYNITVPAIVKQALANTFENTTVSLYPAVTRQSVSVGNSFTVSVTESTQNIVLMPKSDTPLTCLAFEISGTAGQSVSLDFEIVVNGAKNTVTKTVALTSATQTVEINLSSAGAGSVGAYNGNTISYTNTALFNNPDGADSNGNNYIALNLQNNNSAFTVNFTGLYNK